ncbi:MAG: multidrug effflux MFS transporter [Pseudomonadota bacterium]
MPSPSDTHSSLARKPSLYTLVAISMVAPAGINIIAPSMPAFVAVFETDYGTVQLTLSLFLVAIAVAQLIIGPLSDFFGRRPVVLYGMLLSLLGSMMCISASTIEVFILGRIVQGIGACAGIVLARTIVRDLFERERAASMIGYVTMSMAVAPMIVPLIGGALQEYIAWWGSSVFMLLFTFAVFLVALKDLYETNPYLGQRTTAKTLARHYAHLISDKRFVAFTATNAFSSAVYFTFMGGAPLVSSAVLDLSPIGYGSYFILVAVGYSVGNFLSGRFSERVGVVWMIISGCVLNLVGVLVVAALFAVGLSHPFSLFLPMLLTSVANGMTLPSTIAGAISIRPDLAGDSEGLIGFAQIGGAAVAATLTEEWIDRDLSVWPMVIVMFVASAVALMVSFHVRKLESAHAKSGHAIA